MTSYWENIQNNYRSSKMLFVLFITILITSWAHQRWLPEEELKYKLEGYFVIIARPLLAGKLYGGGAQIGESENCDTNELNVCVTQIPRTPVGLPKNKAELDAHCAAYNTGMSCMETWMKRCLPTDGQKLVQQQIGGARALMRFLCTNDTALRRDFLREQSCWSRVSPEWSRCVSELQVAVRDITEQSQSLTYFNANSELCCARDEFLLCVSAAGRICRSTAATLLRRMAWVLAQDVAVCGYQPRPTCAATPVFTTPILTSLSALILYPPLF